MRKTMLKIFAAGLAAASISAFAAPTYAAAQDPTATEQSGWCEVLPNFCCTKNTARCRCAGVTVVRADRRVDIVAGCAPIKED